MSPQTDSTRPASSNSANLCGPWQTTTGPPSSCPPIFFSEVAQLADRVGIIHDGRLVEELSRNDLIAKAKSHSAATLSDQERADALLGLELERYFVARTGAPEEAA